MKKIKIVIIIFICIAPQILAIMRIHVSNLPPEDFSQRKTNLQTLFAKYGPVTSVESRNYRNPSTGETLTDIAIIEMSSENDVQNAIQNLNGTNYKGNKLILKKKSETAKQKANTLQNETTIAPATETP